MFEHAAEGAVQAEQVGRRDALAVGRVRHHERFLGGLDEISNVALLHANDIAHASTLGIVAGYLNGAQVKVVAINMVGKFALLAVIVVNAFEEFGIKVFPFFKTEVLAEHARIDIARYECGLDEDSARTAEGVNEIGVALPTREFDKARSQHLVDRCFALSRAIATQVKAFARRVKGEGALVFGNVDIELDIGLADADIGALARCFAEIINDGVLHLVGYEFRVAELGGINHGVNGEGRVEVEIL